MAESAERCDARCDRRNEFTLADGWYLFVDKSLILTVFFLTPQKLPGGMSAAVGSTRSGAPQSWLFRLSGADITADFPVKKPERMSHLYWEKKKEKRKAVVSLRFFTTARGETRILIGVFYRIADVGQAEKHQWDAQNRIKDGHPIDPILLLLLLHWIQILPLKLTFSPTASLGQCVHNLQE